MLDFRRLAIVPFLLALGACGDDPAPAPKPTPVPTTTPTTPATPPAATNEEQPLEPAPAAPAPAAKIDPWEGPIDPAKVGTIKGVVRFDGEAPKRLPIPITATGCAAHATPPLFETVIVENGKLANVFVTITRGLEKVELPPAEDTPVQLDQNGCLYVPHVLGMRTGQTLAIKNTDMVTHNVNVRESKNQTFNQVQAAGSPVVEWQPKKRELGVGFGCDLHPWMKSYVCVEEHPFWAITGTDGAFSLQGLPPGPYTIEAWHEKYPKQTKKVTLSGTGEQDIEFVFKP